MMDSRPRRILDVGQCDLDHGNVSAMITERFGATVDRAHTIDDAISMIRKGGYDLVLTNRILDADATEGLDLIKHVKTDKTMCGVRVMMISNYKDAQRAAVEQGAEPGFGKAALNESSTFETLSAALRVTNVL